MLIGTSDSRLSLLVPLVDGDGGARIWGSEVSFGPDIPAFLLMIKQTQGRHSLLAEIGSGGAGSLKWSGLWGWNSGWQAVY